MKEQLIRIDHTSSLRAMINLSFHKYDRTHICQSPVNDPETSAAPESASGQTARNPFRTQDRTKG